MFGSVNVNPDYTFTQSENRLFTSNISKAISNYFGNSDVSKKVKSDKTDKNSSDEKTVGSLAQEKNTNKIEEEKKDKTQNLFDDEEDKDNVQGLFFDEKSISITASFDSLAAAVGASDDKVTKSQLMALLQSLNSKEADSSEVSKDVAFLKRLIAKFDVISGGSNYITSFSGVNEPQDYETVTQEQVTSPVDILI